MVFNIISYNCIMAQNLFNFLGGLFIHFCLQYFNICQLNIQIYLLVYLFYRLNFHLLTDK